MTTPEKNPPPVQDATPDSPVASESPQTTDKPDTSEAPESEPVVDAGRPRLVEATVARDRGWNAVVRVVVERRGAERAAERQAVGEEAVVLRTVAQATLDAIAALTGDDGQFALVGAKRMDAFDSSVLLVCVRTLGGAPRKLIGCVPIEDDQVMATARAVLHATNRIVETVPNAPASAESEDDETEPAVSERGETEPAESEDHETEPAVSEHDEAAPAAVEPPT